MLRFTTTPINYSLYCVQISWNWIINILCSDLEEAEQDNNIAKYLVKEAEQDNNIAKYLEEAEQDNIIAKYLEEAEQDNNIAK